MNKNHRKKIFSNKRLLLEARKHPKDWSLGHRNVFMYTSQFQIVIWFKYIRKKMSDVEEFDFDIDLDLETHPGNSSTALDWPGIFYWIKASLSWKLISTIVSWLS